MSVSLVIRPMPHTQGYGFFCPNGPLDSYYTEGYRHEVVGRFNNYHATADAWRWPIDYEEGAKYVIDAFSPNLNKFLHVGHLRQLILASALQHTLHRDTRFVAMLGAAIGIKGDAKTDLFQWFDFVDYRPTVYYDSALVSDGVKVRKPTEEEIAEDAKKPENEQKLQPRDGKLPLVWDGGPNGLVITHTSDGKALYAFHDLCFADEAKPTHYITDHGQKKHFADLGLGDKWRGMGLVLGPDPENPAKWTKYRSRTGEAVLAEDCVRDVIARLGETEDQKRLAWNVLVWNFLQCSREKDVKFETEKWTSPDSPGLYISYTWARVNKALLEHADLSVSTGPASERAEGVCWLFHRNKEKLTQPDIELIAFADQYKYWKWQAVKNLDPAPLANFIHELARKLGTAYHREQVKDGRLMFQASLQFANLVLKRCMRWLGMFTLHTV